MSDIKIKCVDQTLTFVNAPVIASGGVIEDRVVFDFCPLWNGYVKTAVFYRDKTEVFYKLLEADDSCDIPAEVLASSGIVYIGVFGVKDESRRTSELLAYSIREGAVLNIAAPTVDVYAQILEALQSEVVKASNEKFVSHGNITNALARISHYGLKEYIDLSMESGFLFTDGTTIKGESNEAYTHSYYIPVIPNEKLFVTCYTGIETFAINFYDENKLFIEGKLNNSEKSVWYKDEEVIVPNGCFYARINNCSSNVTPTLKHLSYKDIIANLNRLLNSIENENIVLSFEENTDISIVENAYVDKLNGKVYDFTPTVESNVAGVTDLINISDFDTLFVTAYASSNTCIVALYDEKQNFIASMGGNEYIFDDAEDADNTNYYNAGIRWSLRKVSALDLINNYPAVKYVRFGSYIDTLKIFNGVNVSINDCLNDIIDGNKIVSAYTDVTENYTILSPYYISKKTGVDTPMTSGHIFEITDYIEVTHDLDLYVTGRAFSLTCIIALYDENKKFIGKYGHNDFATTGDENPHVKLKRFHVNNRFVNSIRSDAKYIKFGSAYDNLIIETASYMTPKQAHDKYWSGKTWVAFGDSITENNYRTTKHYHDYIAEETGINVLNYGVSGSGYMENSGSEGNEWNVRVNDLSDVDFDVITFFGSGNDLHTSLNATMGTASDTGTDTLGGCINTTLDNLLSIKPLAKIGIITPTPWHYNTPLDHGTMETYSELLIEIAKNRSIPYLDLFHCSTLNPNNDDHNKAFFSCEQATDGDGVHPNAEGHKRFYPMVREFLRTLI